MSRRRSLHVGAAVAGLVALLAAFLLVDPVNEALRHAASGDTAALREQLRGTGAAGIVLLYVLMIAHAVLPFPAEITNLVAGFAYGIPGGIAICATGWFASALCTYAIGRYAGRPLVARLAGPDRLAAAEALMERGGWPALLVLRLLPIVPISGVGYVAGATHVPLVRFAWTSGIGMIPLMAIAVILGSRLEHFSVTDPLVWGMLGGFALLALVSHPIVRRFQRARRVGETA
ncbi:MAG TPA: VTT domain-containing protein [Baekduia sp.]|nr:VTT domain-containing protein [Baekduia sp.]